MLPSVTSPSLNKCQYLPRCVLYDLVLGIISLIQCLKLMCTCFVAIEKNKLLVYESTSGHSHWLSFHQSIHFFTVRVTGQHCVQLCRQRTSSPCLGQDYQGPTLEPGLEPQPSPMGWLSLLLDPSHAGGAVRVCCCGLVGSHWLRSSTSEAVTQIMSGWDQAVF